MHDTVIRGGTIVDGTGNPAFTGDVAIDGDRISRGWRQGRAGEARHRGRRQAGHARLGRRAHALRWPGDLGQGTRAVIMAWRHHHPVRQLRCRLRAGAPRTPRLADRPDGSGGGNPWHYAVGRIEVGLGELPAIPRRARPHAALDRRGGAGAAPSAARLRHGRSRDQSREGHRRRHRRDAPHDARGAGGRRVRLHHLAHQLAQDTDRRDGARPLFRGAGAARHRLRAEGPEARRVRREQRLRHRDRRTRLDDATRPGHRPPGLVPADRSADRSGALAAPDGGRPHCPHARRVRHRADRRPSGRRHARRRYSAESVLDPPELPGAAEAAAGRATDAAAGPRGARVDPGRRPSDELVQRLSQFRMRITTSWDRMFVMGDPPDYEPEASKSIAAMAQRSNHTPDEVAYDYLAGGLDKFLFFPIVGYNRGQSRHHPHHADLTRDGAGTVGWRRALLLDQRCERCRAGC